MILPQELEVFYVIPAIRRELAKALAVKGVKQKRMAEIFGVSEACVSNYFKAKRGQEVTFSTELTKLINESASNLAIGKSCFINVIQQVCRSFKKSEALCDLHHKLDKITCNCKGCLA